MRPIAERFWARVTTGAGCWEWSGAIAKSGYGMIGRGTRDEGVVSTHRLSWELHHGSVPDGLCVLHRCDNRRCVRPDHLFIGTRADNNADMRAKGRGSKPPNRWEARGR
jgi:hypothetical protein